MEYGNYILFVMVFIFFIVFIQPAIQVYLLLRKPRSKIVKRIGLIGLVIHSVFLLLFFYLATFNGVLNFSGHGGKEAPPFIVELMAVFIVASILFFIAFIAAVIGNRINNLNN